MAGSHHVTTHTQLCAAACGCLCWEMSLSLHMCSCAQICLFMCECKRMYYVNIQHVCACIASSLYWSACVCVRACGAAKIGLSLLC